MEPHYVRCIKPNSLNKPMHFEGANVLQQLRCGGWWCMIVWSATVTLCTVCVRVCVCVCVCV